LPCRLKDLPPLPEIKLRDEFLQPRTDLKELAESINKDSLPPALIPTPSSRSKAVAPSKWRSSSPIKAASLDAGSCRLELIAMDSTGQKTSVRSADFDLE
jgi:hypothetical protein